MTRFHSRNDSANGNGNDSDEIPPMGHRLVRRVNYGAVFSCLTSDEKKDAYREVSLRFQFRSPRRNASHYVNYARNCFVVTLLDSLNDIFRPVSPLCVASRTCIRREMRL